MRIIKFVDLVDYIHVIAFAHEEQSKAIIIRTIDNDG